MPSKETVKQMLRKATELEISRYKTNKMRVVSPGRSEICWIAFPIKLSYLTNLIIIWIYGGKTLISFLLVSSFDLKVESNISSVNMEKIDFVKKVFDT